MRVCLGGIVAALATIGWGSLAMTGKDAGAPVARMPKDYAIPVSLDPIERDFPIPETTVIKRREPLTGELVDTDVRLQRTVYQASWLRSYSGAVSEDSGRLTCYELVSKAPYSWAYWTGNPVGKFRFLSLADGTSYIAWVELGGVGLARIDRSLTPTVALMESFRALPNSAMLVPVPELVPRAQHWRRGEVRNVLYADIDILSLERRGNAGLALTIGNPQGTDKVELLYDGSEWSLTPEVEGGAKP